MENNSNVILKQLWFDVSEEEFLNDETMAKIRQALTTASDKAYCAKYSSLAYEVNTDAKIYSDGLYIGIEGEAEQEELIEEFANKIKEEMSVYRLGDRLDTNDKIRSLR